jgi:uncharacterized membrane protein
LIARIAAGMMGAASPPHKAPAVELLSDHGLWLRSIHLVSAISWVGLLWFLDWTLQPAARQMGLHEQRSLWCHLLPRALWWLRWSAAVAWLSGLTYAAFLAAQSDQGLLG